MDVRQLRYFLAVVDQGTVHRAADFLYVAQPSVSHSLRRLEAELGSELFLRRGRGLVLSSAGEALVDPAREIVRLLEVARATVESVEGLRGGRLTIVGQPGTGMRRVADAILATTDCHLAVEMEHREALLPLVLSGVGVAVVAESWRQLADAVGLSVYTLASPEVLYVGLVWQQRRLSPAAAAFVSVSGRDR